MNPSAEVGPAALCGERGRREDAVKVTRGAEGVKVSGFTEAELTSALS